MCRAPSYILQGDVAACSVEWELGERWQRGLGSDLVTWPLHSGYPRNISSQLPGAWADRLASTYWVSGFAIFLIIPFRSVLRPRGEAWAGAGCQGARGNSTQRSFDLYHPRVMQLRSGQPASWAGPSHPAATSIATWFGTRSLCGLCSEAPVHLEDQPVSRAASEQGDADFPHRPSGEFHVSHTMERRECQEMVRS